MSDQGSERRQGYDEFTAVIKEANRNLMTTVTQKLNEHAAEFRTGLAKLHTSVELSAQKVVYLEEKVEQIAKNDITQFSLITETRGSLRDLEVKVAKIPNVKSSIAAVKSTSFWATPNGKYVIWGVIVFLIGMFGIAGINMTEMIKF